MLWVKKCHFFLYLDLVKIRLEILLNYFEERKETFQTIKKRIFQVQKIAFFSKGLTHAFGQNLIKISLEIMLSDFAEKKETFLTLKIEFVKVQKIAPFQRG